MQEQEQIQQKSAESKPSPPLAKAPLSPFRLPADTAPTWEVELLLSGATVFALMQLPAWLGAEMLFWEARTQGSLNVVLGMTGVFAKVIAYALISTLLAHLMTRALWVAAIGLRSVYPLGIRWRKLRYGPRYRAVARRELPTLKRLIERSDDIASQMFAVAAVLVVMVLYSVLMMALLVLAAWALSLLVGGRHFAPILMALMAGWIALQLLSNQLDKRISRRAPAAAWLRWVPAVHRLQLLVPLARLSTSLMLVFSSRFGSVRGSLGLMAMVYALMGLAILDHVWERQQLSAGEARFIAELDGAHVLQPAHYADQRQPLVDALVPYVQSMNPREPYLRLRIPFHVERHGSALESLCAGSQRSLRTAQEQREAAQDELDEEASSRERLQNAALSEASAAQALLDCARRLHALRLDGQPLEVGFEFHAGRDEELPGFVAMIPLAELVPGRHVLEVANLPRPHVDELLLRRKAKPAPPPRQIVFWK